MNRQKNPSLPAKQQGVVLVVCLVILTVLTIIAVNTATDLGLQSNMARNSQFNRNVFNVAHSEINAQITDVRADQQRLVQAINNNPSEVVLGAGDYLMEAGLAAAGTDNFTQTFVYDYQETTEYLPDGFTTSSHIGHLFNLNSTARIDQTGTLSNQTQGIIYAGPKQQ